MMPISIATATFYFLPFEETLEIIAEAGFRNIELDLFWERKNWAMAQHLRDVPVSQAIQSIHRSGLRVSSIHDGGGVLNDPYSAEDYINLQLNEYLDQLGYAPENLVFHTPHAEGNLNGDWWKHISVEILRALEPYRAFCSLTLENMPNFEGYTVSLTTPEELRAFVTQNGLGVNLDTTHYAYMGVDIKKAARILHGTIHSIHLSDYASDRPHAFIGEGELDLAGFFNLMEPEIFKMVTLECSVSSAGRSDRQMGHDELVKRLILLIDQVKSLTKS